MKRKRKLGKPVQNRVYECVREQAIDAVWRQTTGPLRGKAYGIMSVVVHSQAHSQLESQVFRKLWKVT